MLKKMSQFLHCAGSEFIVNKKIATKILCGEEKMGCGVRGIVQDALLSQVAG
jgi:hypothetical protein